MNSTLNTKFRPNRLRSVLGAGLLLLGLMPAGAAMAGDGKVYSPNACSPAFHWQAQHLASWGASLQNISSTATVVVRCPVVKDHVGGTKLNYMSVTYRSPQAGNFSCGFVAAAQQGSAAYSRWLSGPQTSSTRTLSAQDLTAYSSGPVYMYCYLPPQSTLKNYRVDED